MSWLGPSAANIPSASEYLSVSSRATYRSRNLPDCGGSAAQPKIQCRACSERLATTPTRSEARALRILSTSCCFSATDRCSDAFASCCSVIARSWPSPPRITRYCQYVGRRGKYARDSIYIGRIVVRVIVQEQANLIPNSKLPRFHDVPPERKSPNGARMAPDMRPLPSLRPWPRYEPGGKAIWVATAAQCKLAPSITDPCHATL